MIEEDLMPDTERHEWAICDEPYQTRLNNLASEWLHGQVSDEQLALQAVQMLSKVDWGDSLNRTVTSQHACVVDHIRVLVDAMIAASRFPEQSYARRLHALDFMSSAGIGEQTRGLTR